MFLVPVENSPDPKLLFAAKLRIPRRSFSPLFSQTFGGDDVAHALMRAASALVPTPCPDRLAVPHRSVERSLDTARTSACATPSGRMVEMRARRYGRGDRSPLHSGFCCTLVEALHGAVLHGGQVECAAGCTLNDGRLSRRMASLPVVPLKGTCHAAARQAWGPRPSPGDRSADRLASASDAASATCASPNGRSRLQRFQVRLRSAPSYRAPRRARAAR